MIGDWHDSQKKVKFFVLLHGRNSLAGSAILILFRFHVWKFSYVLRIVARVWLWLLWRGSRGPTWFGKQGFEQFYMEGFSGCDLPRGSIFCDCFDKRVKDRQDNQEIQSFEQLHSEVFFGRDLVVEIVKFWAIWSEGFSSGSECWILMRFCSLVSCD